MSRAAALLLAALTACAPAADDGSSPRPPNVLLLVIDTLRTDHLSSYGYGWPTTPNIDALAQRGVRFDDCTAGASWTMPSMISLMTGRRLLTVLYRIPDSHPVLAERFAEGGYRTGAFVANSLVSAESGFARGVEAWDARQRSTPQWTADDVIGRAVAFLDGADERPFFLWLHFLDTHDPYTPESVPWKRKPDEVFGPDVQALIEASIASAPEADRPWLGYQLGMLADEVNRYDGELLFLDERIGGLLARMQASGQLDNTVVALVADHGETLFQRPEHGSRMATMRRYRSDQGERMRLEDYVKKQHDGTVFQELVRTPFILAGPGIPPGQVSNALVCNLDVVPTLLGLAGLQPLAGEGRDLSGVLRRGAPVPDAEWVTSASSLQLMARLPGGAKLVLTREPVAAQWGGEPQLFDLSADPGEARPLPLDPYGEALSRRLNQAADQDPHRNWDGSAPDGETLQVLRELGYVR